MIESFVFLGLSLNAWITIVLVLVMFGLLLFTKLPADVVFVGGMAVLLVCGVLPAKEVLSGFSTVRGGGRPGLYRRVAVDSAPFVGQPFVLS